VQINANRVLEQNEELTLAEAERLLGELAAVPSSGASVDEEQIQASGGKKQKRSSERPGIETRYRALVEQIPAVIFMAFLDEGVSEAYVSPHIETVLGFTQEEWLNDPIRWYQHIHPEDRERWSIEAAQLVLSGRPLRSVYRVMALDGHVVWFHCQVKLVSNDNGQPWFIHGTAFDITELKKAEYSLQEAHDQLETRVRERTAELARANAELEREILDRKRAQSDLARKAEELARSNTDLEQFAYSASHDLQEPLRNITIYSQLLRKRYKARLDTDADSFIEILGEGADRIATMVSDLRSYTETALANEEIDELVDANATLAKTLENLRVVIRDNQASITHNRLPWLQVREVHLQQLFQNLVGNAIKYRGDEAPRVHISAAVRNGECIFSVKDNGIGIAREYHERIFGVFKRLRGRERYPGSGIGLAICKRIVERYEGRIWVESEPHRGAVFFFTLPMEDQR
jgi:PAS domain S-box-containing protein